MKKAKLSLRSETIINSAIRTLSDGELPFVNGGVEVSSGCPTMTTKPACDPKPPGIARPGESA